MQKFHSLHLVPYVALLAFIACFIILYFFQWIIIVIVSVIYQIYSAALQTQLHYGRKFIYLLYVTYIRYNVHDNLSKYSVLSCPRLDKIEEHITNYKYDGYCQQRQGATRTGELECLFITNTLIFEYFFFIIYSR